MPSKIEHRSWLGRQHAPHRRINIYSPRLIDVLRTSYLSTTSFLLPLRGSLLSPAFSCPAILLAMLAATALLVLAGSAVALPSANDLEPRRSKSKSKTPYPKSCTPDLAGLLNGPIEAKDPLSEHRPPISWALSRH